MLHCKKGLRAPAAKDKGRDESLQPAYLHTGLLVYSGERGLFHSMLSDFVVPGEKKSHELEQYHALHPALASVVLWQ